MKDIKSWSFFICLISIGCTAIELLLPPGKISKTMYTVLGLFTVCCGIFSFSSIHKDFKYKFPDISTKHKLSKNTGFINNLDSQISNLVCQNIKAVVEHKLIDIDVVPKKIEIFMDTIKDNCILMIRCKIYIENKYKDLKLKIYDEISKKLNIPTEIIEV